MGTTMYFEETLRDHGDRSEPIELEFGSSTFYGDGMIYLVIDGHTVILSPEMGRKLAEAMGSLSRYLGYQRRVD